MLPLLLQEQLTASIDALLERERRTHIRLNMIEKRMADLERRVGDMEVETLSAFYQVLAKWAEREDV